MTISMTRNPVTVPTMARIWQVSFDEDYLHCELTDGRKVSVPLAWYPRLLNASAQQRQNYQIIGGGYGIHWPELDEDLSVKGFLAGAEN